jgi:hypothetical protein
MQSYIRPRRWSIVAPGHHGEPRTGGQSLISSLEGPAVLSALFQCRSDRSRHDQDVLAEHSVDKFVMRRRPRTGRP